MGLSLPAIVTRAGKGSALTIGEMDGDLTVFKNFVNALAALIGTSLNTDGSLKSSVVPTSSLQDRSITQAKLDAACQFVKLSTGAANAYEVAFTPVITAYANGQVYFCFAHQSNTGATTFKVDGLAATAVVKKGGDPLVGGEIISGGVFIALPKQC